MGFLNNLFGKKEEEIQEEVKAPVASINAINLRKEKVGICLAKKNMADTKARVGLVIDDSGSMEWLYDNGTMQEVIERLLPVALKLDANAELDIWIFDSSCRRLKSITEYDFSNYVNRVVRKNATWGGTNYSVVMNDIVKKYVSEEPSNTPSFVMFLTDGETMDTNQARKAITEASKHNIFWQFIGIGDERFSFLNELDTMEGRTVDNANFFKINDITKISDDQLYDMLLNEYPSWEREARNLGIIK